MSEPTSSDVHVEGTSWKFNKPNVSRAKRRRGYVAKATSSGVEALTNTIADARLPGYVKSLRAALKVLRGGLADDAGTIAALKKLDARTLDGLQSFRDFVETLTSGAEKELLTTLAATGAAGARAADLAGFSFDIMNEAALAWAKARAADLVTAISERTRDGIKKIVENAYQLEKDVPSTARDIRGRLERDLGNFGGLTERDATAVDRFRSRLIDDGADPDVADSKAAKLADGYRRDRSETIARTELIAASNQGQLQLWQQAVEGGLLDDGARREWILTDDSITCPTCEAIVADYPDGVAMDETFTTEDGDELDGPPAHPRCRCTTALVSGRSAIAQATGEAGADNPVDAAINDAEEEVGKLVQFMKDFDESKHPRGEGGKFAPGSGGQKPDKQALFKLGKNIAKKKYMEKLALESQYGKPLPAAIKSTLDTKWSKAHDEAKSELAASSKPEEQALPAAATPAEAQTPPATEEQAPLAAPVAAKPEPAKSGYAQQLEQMTHAEKTAFKIGKNVAKLKYEEKKSLEATQGHPLTDEQKKTLGDKYAKVKQDQFAGKGLGPKAAEPEPVSEAATPKAMELAAKASSKMSPAEFAKFQTDWKNEFGFNYNVPGKVSGLDKLLAKSPDKDAFQASMAGMKSDYQQQQAAMKVSAAEKLAASQVAAGQLSKLADELDQQMAAKAESVLPMSELGRRALGAREAEVRQIAATRLAALSATDKSNLQNTLMGLGEGHTADSATRETVERIRGAARRAAVDNPTAVAAYENFWGTWVGNSTSSPDSRILKSIGEKAFDGRTISHDMKYLVGSARDKFVQTALSNVSAAKTKGLGAADIEKLMHANRIVTHERLKASLPPGTKELILYRGMRSDGFTTIGRKIPDYGSETRLLFNSVTPFTSSKQVARNFGDVVFEVRVPIDEIVVEHASSKPFRNHPHEREYIVATSARGRLSKRVPK